MTNYGSESRMGMEKVRYFNDGTNNGSTTLRFVTGNCRHPQQPTDLSHSN